MNEHVHDQLAYYRDLAPEARRTVEAHLAHCAECRATLAAYQRQEAALRALPTLRARPRPHPGRAAPRPRLAVVARLGDALAIGGLAALVWLFGLQVQAVAQGGGALVPAALEPGLTLPPMRVALPSPWLAALPWLAAALLGVGTLFILTRRSVVPTLIGAGVAALLLISFVPPFSLAPNPLGLYWRVAGGYEYDPRLPFKNNFLIVDSPEATLRPRLDALIGRTGLSPLDPNQPLASYEFLRVGLHPQMPTVALVTTRFVYADGSSRIYPVPLLRPVLGLAGFWQAAWTADGLQRLRSEHLDFPGQPFAPPEATVRLGAVRELPVHPAANRLDEANPAHWLWESVRSERLVVAPDGSGVLVAIDADQPRRQLWLVPFDGGPPTAVGAPTDLREYGFSPDGQYIVYTHIDPAAFAADTVRPYAISVLPRTAAGGLSSGRAEGAYFAPYQVVTGLFSERLPGLTAEGLWFVSEGRLWRAPYSGGAPVLLQAAAASQEAPRPAPDGGRVALACGEALCLSGATGEAAVRVPGLTPAEMTWTADGTQLAVVDRDRNNQRPVRLWVFTRAGAPTLTVEIAPRDVTDPPQWTPDGAAILVQTYPQDGRRIIAVDVARQAVWDLSREHWDAYFTLLPGGRSLLLNNGRGGFWEAELIVAPGP